MITNLVPFPRIHFPIVSYAPFISKDKVPDQSINIDDLTDACFNADYRLIKCDSKKWQILPEQKILAKKPET